MIFKQLTFDKVCQIQSIMKISETLHACLTTIKIFGFFLYDMINSNDKIHIPQFFAQLFRTEYFF